jgi:hypothetical protein
VLKFRREIGVLRGLTMITLLVASGASTLSSSSTSTSSTRRTFSTVRTFLGAFFAPTLLAQAPSRLATTREALIASPVFFHGKQIVVRADVETTGRLTRVAGTTKPVFVFWREPPAGTSNAELRGEFWDLGRLERSDPRFSSIDFGPILEAASHGQWPPREQVFLLLGASTAESPLPAEPSIRALALAPEGYVGKGVTVTGRFRGANLYADLPQGAGTKGRWDFVLQSADAAVWVTGVRPRGKGFDLDVNARADTGRWLQVAGTVRRDGPLAFIEATSVVLASAPSETTVDVTLPPPTPEAAPLVVFSIPAADETDADRTMPIKIQFSRDMDPKTFGGRVRLTYVGPPPAGAAAMPAVTVRYVEGNRALEITPATPLDRYRTVKVELLEGITSAVDNQPFAPWSMTFTTGG